MRSVRLRACPKAAWLLCLLLLWAAPAAALTFVEIDRDGVGGVDGLGNARGADVSPDGAHVYVASCGDSALALFSRNPVTGALTFVEAKFDGVGGVDGLGCAEEVVVSPDGKHVYVTSFFDAALAVFSRNAVTGTLTFVQVLRDGVGGVDGLSPNMSLTISPDGRHVYVSSFDDSSVAVFSRNTTTGALTFVETKTDGVGGVDGIGGAYDVEVSPDGRHVYVPGNGVGENSVATFSRNATTGALTFVDAKFDGVGGVQGLSFARKVALSPGGEHLYVSSGGGAALATFSRNSTTGALTFVDAQFGAGGLVSPLALTVSPDGTEVYVLDPNANLLVVLERNPTTGVLSVAETLEDGVGGVDGLDGADTVTVSPDGAHVYVTAGLDNSVALFLNDIDADGVPDAADNCPRLPNPGQADADGAGLGDVCDPCPGDPANLCRFISGGGPDPQNPAQSILLAINPGTGGAPFARANLGSARAGSRSRGRSAAPESNSGRAVAPGSALEVINFRDLTALTCNRKGELYGGLGALGGGLIIKRERSTGSWVQVGTSQFRAVAGLATSLSGTIFASVESGTPRCAGDPGRADTLATVNPTTGVATPVGLYGSLTTQMDGLDFDPISGVLYGVTGAGDCRAGGPGPALYTINPATGTATRVGLIRDANGQPPVASPGGLAVGRDGTLFASLGGNIGDIVTIDRTTARFTRVGSTGAGGSVEALTFCPVLDRFLSYKSASATAFTPVSVNLADLFDQGAGGASVTATQPASIGNPASDTGDGIENAGLPLTGYRMIQTAPRGVRQVNIRVLDPIGKAISVDTVKPERLLVPSAFGTTAPVPGSHFVDHYKCYKVKVSKGTPKFTARTESVGDAFPSSPKLSRVFTVKKPRHLCTQANQNGQGLLNPGVHLMCYQVKLASGQPKRDPLVGTVVTGDAPTGTAQLNASKEDELCVPCLIGEDGG